MMLMIMIPGERGPDEDTDMFPLEKWVKGYFEPCLFVPNRFLDIYLILNMFLANMLLLPPTRRLCFWFGLLVCLSVCLFVCLFVGLSVF